MALTLGPMLVTVVGSLISGIGVKGMWGSPGLNLAGLIAVMLTGGRLTPKARDRLAVMAAVFMLLVPIGYAVSTLAAPLYGRPKRQNYPQAKIAATMRALFQAATNRPLTIVVGEQFNWVGGLIGLSARQMADVSPNGDLRLTPWITPDRMAHEGYMIAWEQNGRGGGPSENLRALALGYPVEQVQFAWPRFPAVPPLIIAYVIVPPGR